MEACLHLFLTSVLGGGVWLALLPCRLNPGEIASGFNLIGGWIDTRAAQDICRSDKCLSSPGIGTLVLPSRNLSTVPTMLPLQQPLQAYVGTSENV